MAHVHELGIMSERKCILASFTFVYSFVSNDTPFQLHVLLHASSSLLSTSLSYPSYSLFPAHMIIHLPFTPPYLTQAGGYSSLSSGTEQRSISELVHVKVVLAANILGCLFCVKFLILCQGSWIKFLNASVPP